LKAEERRAVFSSLQLRRFADGSVKTESLTPGQAASKRVQ
jgi:hypothetical protein